MDVSVLPVITDMSGAATGTVGLPSGSIPPLSPEAAARVKTTSTARGEDCLVYVHFFVSVHKHACFGCAFWDDQTGF